MNAPGGENVLVIGAGFIGTHVARAFLDSGVPTRVLTRPTSAGSAALAGAEILGGEASDPVLLERALRGTRLVVYCAGGLMPAASSLQPLADVALTLPPVITLLEALRTRPETELIFLSSGGTVYGVPTSQKVDEDHPTEPSCPYGILKLATEKYIGLYTRVHGVRARILRCSNVYGEGQPPDRGQGVIATWLHRILSNEPITIFGDGSSVRDYVYVGDLASLIVSIAGRRGGPQVMNVGSGEGTSLNELLRQIEVVAGKPVPAEYLPARDVDIPRIVLDITRVKRFAGFRPSSLETGLERTWAGALETLAGAPSVEVVTISDLTDAWAEPGG